MPCTVLVVLLYQIYLIYSISCLWHTVILWKVNSTQSSGLWSFPDDKFWVYSNFLFIYCCSYVKIHWLLKVLNFVFLSHSLELFGSFYCSWLYCLLPVVYNIVITVLLIFILSHWQKYWGTSALRWIFKEFLNKPFFALSQCYLLPSSWGSFFMPHIVSFLIFISFSLTGSFPMRHSIKYLIKVRIDEIYWMPFIRKA